MGVAYERALQQLGLKDRSDPVTETVAKLIIEVGQTGERDPNTICALALSRRATRIAKLPKFAQQITIAWLCPVR